MTVLAHSQTTNKLVNEAANDCKIPPALGTNQIARVGGFRPLASLEKNYFLLLSPRSAQFFISYESRIH